MLKEVTELQKKVPSPALFKHYLTLMGSQMTLSNNYFTCSIKSVVLFSLCKCVEALRFSFPSIFLKPVPGLFFSFVGELSLEGDAISAIRLCWEWEYFIDLYINIKKTQHMALCMTASVLYGSAGALMRYGLLSAKNFEWPQMDGPTDQQGDSCIHVRHILFQATTLLGEKFTASVHTSLLRPS